MTENKMTESEIMKALEIHADNEAGCSECPIYHSDTGDTCAYELAQNALALINRKNAECKECGIRTSECIDKLQKQIAEKDAENEKLCGEIDELIIAKDQLFDEAEALIKKARAEAIKEVLQKARKHAFPDDFYGEGCVYIANLDQIAKEMGVEL